MNQQICPVIWVLVGENQMSGGALALDSIATPKMFDEG